MKKPTLQVVREGDELPPPPPPPPPSPDGLLQALAAACVTTTQARASAFIIGYQVDEEPITVMAWPPARAAREGMATALYNKTLFPAGIDVADEDDD